MRSKATPSRMLSRLFAGVDTSTLYSRSGPNPSKSNATRRATDATMSRTACAAEVPCIAFCYKLKLTSYTSLTAHCCKSIKPAQLAFIFLCLQSQMPTNCPASKESTP
jgi:hypothetical protein